MSPLYIQNPNDATSGSTIPRARDGIGFYSHATCPAASTATKRPSYVMVNTNGTYAFCYDSGQHATTSSYITGSVHPGANAGPFRLDIQPVAWRQTNAAGDVGDITFVYVRVG